MSNVIIERPKRLTLRPSLAFHKDDLRSIGDKYITMRDGSFVICRDAIVPGSVLAATFIQSFPVCFDVNNFVKATEGDVQIVFQELLERAVIINLEDMIINEKRIRYLGNIRIAALVPRASFGFNLDKILLLQKLLGLAELRAANNLMGFVKDGKCVAVLAALALQKGDISYELANSTQ